jgi:hypothetical protein
MLSSITYGNAFNFLLDEYYMLIKNVNSRRIAIVFIPYILTMRE